MDKDLSKALRKAEEEANVTGKEIGVFLVVRNIHNARSARYVTQPLNPWPTKKTFYLDNDGTFSFLDSVYPSELEEEEIGDTFDDPAEIAAGPEPEPDPWDY